MELNWLFERFQSYGDREAIIWRGQNYTYEQLAEEIQRWSNRMQGLEISRGSIVSIQGDYSPSTVPLLFAFWANQCVTVPMANVTEQNRKQFLEIGEVTHSLEFSSTGKSDEFELVCYDREATNPFYQQLRETGHPGLVLFSSGTTGTPKAMVHNLSMFLEKYRVERLARRTLAFLLFDHIGGINTLLHVLSNGGTLVVPSERKPEHICSLIEEHRVELLPTTPSFLNLLIISEEYIRYDLSSLKLITYGTEVMPETLLKKLHERLPDVQLTQTYGLSEVGILRAKSKGEDSVMVRVGGEGIEVKVVDDVLWLRSKFRMLGYLNAPQPFDEEGWFCTGDQVEQQGEFLRILGRKSDIINVGGQKVYPTEVENVILGMQNVKDVLVYKEKNPILGEVVAMRVALINPEERVEFKRRMHKYCKSRLESFKIPVKLEIVHDPQHNDRYKKVRRI